MLGSFASVHLNANLVPDDLSGFGKSVGHEVHFNRDASAGELASGSVIARFIGERRRNTAKINDRLIAKRYKANEPVIRRYTAHLPLSVRLDLRYEQVVLGANLPEDL